MNDALTAVLRRDGFRPYADSVTGDRGWINEQDASITELILFGPGAGTGAYAPDTLPIILLTWDKMEPRDTANTLAGFTLGDVIRALTRAGDDREELLSDLLGAATSDTPAADPLHVAARAGAGIVLDSEPLITRHVAYDPAADLTVTVEPANRDRIRAIVIGPDPLERPIDSALVLIWRGPPSTPGADRVHQGLTAAALPALVAALGAVLAYE